MAERPTEAGRPARGRVDFDRIAWPIFGVAAALAAACILWAGRSLTYSADDLVQFMVSPQIDFDGLIAPYNGHFVLVPRLIIKGGLEVFGSSYQTFQLITVAFVLITCALLFTWLGRRVGRLVALAPTLVLLVLGSDYGHVLQGGFTLWLAISCGIGALLALERNDGAGDVLACALLSVGVATYSVALAFVVGCAVVILTTSRWPRLWVIAVPIVIYGIWWLHARGAAGDPQGQVTLSNVMLLPSWAFQSLSTALGAVSGLDASFGDPAPPRAGPVLAIAVAAAAGWRLARSGGSLDIWSAGAALIILWTIGVLASSSVRSPTADRYLLPVIVLVLLLAGALAAGAVWRRPALIALFVVAGMGAVVNLKQLIDGGDNLRDTSTPTTLTQLGAVQVAGPAARPDFALEPGQGNLVELAFSIISNQHDSAVESYLRATDRYGPVGFSPSELEALPDPSRASVDGLLIDLEGVRLEPVPSPGGADCARLDLEPGPGSFELAPGDAVTIDAPEGPVGVAMRRFADPTATEMGEVKPATAAELRVPDDTVDNPWTVALSGSAARVCEST